MNPLKILHVINVPWYNAVAWYGVQTALAQSRLGHWVAVAGDPGSPSVTEADRLGLHDSIRLPLSVPNPLHQFLSARKLRRYIEDRGVDVVNAHQGNGFWMIAHAARSAKNRPLLVRTRGDIRWPRNNIFNRRLYGRVSDGVIATSQVTFDRMAGTFPLSPARIRLVLPSVDTDLYRRGEGAEESDAAEPFPVFGLVGRIDKKKGHKIALAALKRLTDAGHNVRCVVAGREQDLSYEALKTFARENRLVQRTFFLGPVTDVRDVMRICDCGIIASTESEAICRVALEFMAMRVPVIASNLHGIPDVVKEGVNGFLFPTGDEEALARVMEAFLQNRNQWGRLKSGARKWAEDHHSLDRLGNESVEFYRALQNLRPASP